MLADSQAELYAGWSMAQDCARRFDAKEPGRSNPDVSMRASCCKLWFCCNDEL
jgi:acyl-CoA dehydrogenase